MELDSRIVEGKKPLTCFDAEEAKKYVGKKCYLTNDISRFSDLDVFKDIEGCKSVPNEYDGIINTLSDIDTEISMVFETTFLRWKFCIPCEWVKEAPTPEYVPYTLDTWEQEFKTGDVVFFKGKEDTWKDKNYYKCMYLGHLENEKNRILVILGCWLFAFDELIDSFEIYRNGNWEPFGEKVNEGKK